MEWTDVYSGRRFGITTAADADARLVRVKSYEDVLAEYLTHPEPKSARPDGAPCSRSTIGLLSRRAVCGTRILYIGKESNRLEDVDSETVHSWDEVREIHIDPRCEPFRTYVVPILKRLNCAELARAAGVSDRYIKALRNGHRQPSASVRSALTKIAADYARRFLPEQLADDVDACAAFSSEKCSDL